MSALAAVANNHHRRMADAEVVPESIENRLSKLPDEQHREFDVILGMLMLNG